ncbi:putative mus38-like protein [Erysiphe necator]|uniref:Putative mus38-like protein n=1 Tax=Uncinula necator TaxID=52586 RepID=A0A0B1PI93_UNCNE|nr:putative mus38-like protein [Erysiphe necator]
MSCTDHADHQFVKLSLPLKYQQELFHELRQKDELVIIARGLGLLRLITNVLHSYDAAGNNFILLIGANDRENGWIGEALAEQAAISATPKARGLTVINTEVMSVGNREKAYIQGGIFSITSQILVVDLLTGLLNPSTITGLIVLHAERIIATSLEAFILRIFRQRNKAGFIKAFSDNPEPFTTGFAPLTTMLRNLFLRNVSLWPRFQIVVAKALEGEKKAEVIELEVPMSDSMRDIQNAIIECVEVSIGELRKNNPHLEINDWNFDSVLLKQFDIVIRRQLDPAWHRISWKTKQIVSDLTVLRGMLHSLLTYDAVSFNRHLDTILATHSPPPGSMRQNQSPWLFLDAAHTIFDTAKRRVYSGKIIDGSLDNIEMVHPVLEEQPKWSVLAEVLEEIDRDLYFNAGMRDNSNGVILVMCSDTLQCQQLKEYLQTMYIRPEAKKAEDMTNEPSAELMMRRKLRHYLKWKKEFINISTTLFSEGHVSSEGRPNQTLKLTTKSRGKPPANKRRRVRGGASTGTGPSRASNGSVQAAKEKPQELASLISEIQPTLTESEQKEDLVTDPLDDMETFYQLYQMQDLVVIHTYDGDMDEHVLEELKPKYIIMYDPDTAFVRRIEVYRSSHNERNVKVYFLYYGGSVEEQRYLSSVRREKDSFTKLIKEKSTMSVVLNHDSFGVEDVEEAFLRTVNTRIAGGGHLVATGQPPRVVVDIREFRSSLPSLLHGRNIVVVPCMLTVGDYILSPNICVERKSTRDLISSLNNGRLYYQAESMIQHYKSPMLLIEFDQNKSFTLEPFADLSGSLSSISASNANSDLQSKIVQLTLAFPQLRIIWSSSPYQTAEIFETLKSQESEPDPLIAVKIGLEDGLSLENRTLNREPQDMLRAVPGVSGRNINYLIAEMENIRAVADASEKMLETAVGKEAGKQICRFFNLNVLE